MKYLIMIYHNPETMKLWDSMPEEMRTEGIKAHMAFMDDLADSGELVMSEALADASQAKRVRVQDGETRSSDGPFAEVKEFLAGFYLIQCDSVERAIERAGQIPEASVPQVRIEVRPVLERGALDL